MTLFEKYNKYCCNLNELKDEEIIKYISLGEIEVDKDYTVLSWEHIRNNPFLTKYKQEKEMLGIECLYSGMLFPLVVFEKSNGKYLIKEGRHRLASFKLLEKSQVIDKTFLLPCIIYDQKEDKKVNRKYLLYTPGKEQKIKEYHNLFDIKCNLISWGKSLGDNLINYKNLCIIPYFSLRNK